MCSVAQAGSIRLDSSTLAPKNVVPAVAGNASRWSLPTSLLAINRSSLAITVRRRIEIAERGEFQRKGVLLVGNQRSGVRDRLVKR
jgi:hypothetical protein